MPIPNLTLRPGAELWAEGVGDPVNGNNTFQIGIGRENVDSDDQLKITVDRLGTSVVSYTYVPASLDLTVDPPRITLNFDQNGADQVLVRVRLLHTVIR